MDNNILTNLNITNQDFAKWVEDTIALMNYATAEAAHYCILHKYRYGFLVVSVSKNAPDQDF